jgi:hypothetical protein
MEEIDMNSKNKRDFYMISSNVFLDFLTGA